MFSRHFIVILALALTACGQEQEDPNKSVALAQQENVLVTVNGEAITDNDLDAAIVRTLGEYASYQLDEKGRAKMLESLVLSKAMSITQKSQMSESEIADIDHIVSAYREEIMTKRYLQDNVTPLPVSNAMVENYYNQHPEQFGGKTIKTFEVIKGLTKNEGAARQKMIDEINRLATTPNWKTISTNFKIGGSQLEYSTGAVSSGVLKSDIDGILQSLSVNQTSDINFINQLPLIVRVVSEKVISPKPLKLVSSDIKKSLAPIQLKKSVKKLSEKILKEVNVQYSVSSINNSNSMTNE